MNLLQSLHVTLHSSGKRPTLPQILSFPFAAGNGNIAQKVAEFHETFGILLLDDEDGSLVHGLIAPNQTPCNITLAILRKWIQGEGKKPITWATLIAAIRDAGCATLAEDITAGLPNLH